jgi:BlaI family transcriptional regulator, penicillinase repressor
VDYVAKKATQTRPTDSELAILRILWERGPSTVRDVHDELARTRQSVYTSTLKLMQIMAEKGIVQRDESQRSHVYKPAVNRNDTERRLVRDILNRLFDGSPRRLVLQALSSKRATPEELAEIRELLDELEGRNK